MPCTHPGRQGSTALHSCVRVGQWPEQQVCLVAVVLPCTGWPAAECPATGCAAAGGPATDCARCSRLHEDTVTIRLHSTATDAYVIVHAWQPVLPSKDITQGDYVTKQR